MTEDREHQGPTQGPEVGELKEWQGTPPGGAVVAPGQGLKGGGGF